MKPAKRRSKPRLPEFPPVERLVVGQAFNPFGLFVSGSVIRAIGRYDKLSSAGKWLLVTIADQCLRKGFDWHSQRELAELAGIHTRQLRTHLQRLKRLHLIHIEPELGRSDRIWCLFHPLFADCSPLPPAGNRLSPRQEPAEGVGRNLPPHGLNHGLNAWTGGVSQDKSTNGSGSLPLYGEEKVKVPGNAGRPGTGSDNEYFGNVLLPLRRTPGFYALGEREKHQLANRIHRALERICDSQKYLDDPNAAIGRQARMEIARAVRELDNYGALRKNVTLGDFLCMKT